MQAASLALAGPADLIPLLGTELPPGAWQLVSTQRLALFANALGAADPCSTEIRSFFLISLLGPMVRSALGFTSVRMGINYGLEDVQWLAPPVAGETIRPRFTAHSATSLPDGGHQIVLLVAIESRDRKRSLMLARTIGRYYV